MENVNAALEPQEKTILDNVLALIQELLAMQGAEEPPAMIAEAEGEPPEEMDPAQALDLKKAVINETGDTKAEDRLSNQTEITDESMTDLKKSLKQAWNMVNKEKAARKTKTSSAILNELKKITATISEVVKAQQTQEQLNHSLMEAIGFSDEMVSKSLQQVETPKQENKPFQSQDTSLLIKDIVVEVFKNMPQNQPTNPDSQQPFNRKSDEVRKGLNNVVDFICDPSKRRVG